LIRDGDNLPDPDRASIADEKLRDYALNPDHDEGKHKARVFVAMLGIERDDFEFLRDQILAGIRSTPVHDVRPHRYGTRCSVRLEIEGRAGMRANVMTGWMVPDDGSPPHLTSLYVDL
jgi:hypothetical protein